MFSTIYDHETAVNGVVCAHFPRGSLAMELGHRFRNVHTLPCLRVPRLIVCTCACEVSSLRGR